MRRLLIVVAALATATSAAAGGFATVGVSPLPAGDSTVWEPTLTVRAHGVTPVDGVEPVITIWRSDRPSQMLEYKATPAGEPGTYSARVEFPGPGTWEYTIGDGYAGQVHTFKPVEIGAAASGSTARLPWLLGAGVPGAAALALLLLLLLLLLRRRGRSSAAPATAAP